MRPPYASYVSPQRPAGSTLLEVLLALLVLGLGLSALVRAQTGLWQATEQARQRAEAARLAQDDLEQARAYSQLGAASGASSWLDLGGRAATELSGSARNTIYRHQRSVELAGDVPQLKSVVSRILWADRRGQPQQLDLPTLIGAIDPGLGGMLLLAPGTRSLPRLPGAQARHALIPRGARDLGDGRSAYKPRADQTLTWVFNNLDGSVQSRCDSNIGLSSADLTAASLSNCRSLSGLLLSGQIRFATDSGTPDPELAASAALDLELRLTLSGNPPAPGWHCSDNATTGAFSWVSYHCLIELDALLPAPSWSGRLDVVPQGWSLDPALPGALRVCRYSADLDRDGRIGNAEHPAVYSQVREPLGEQNFLIVQAAAGCPPDPARAPLGSPANPVDDGTVAHQP
jgi:Tfp pilus assembly protein PilV